MMLTMTAIRRRTLLQNSAVATLLSATAGTASGSEEPPMQQAATPPNMLGAYGSWAAEAVQDPPRLSFRQAMFTDAGAWRPMARAQFRERLIQPGGAATPVPSVVRRVEFDGLSIEQLQWQLPFGPPTE